MTPAAGYDVAVVGGGIVGASIAYGLAQLNQRVAVFDDGDRALRAAKSNFGLVWLQSKGTSFPAYARWTRKSADLWPDFCERVQQDSGVDLAYRKVGGLNFCLGEAELAARKAMLLKQAPIADVYGTELLDRGHLQRLLPGVELGEDVLAASFGPHDGTCNPLALLRGLHLAMKRRGVDFFPDHLVGSVTHRDRRFLVSAGGHRFEAQKIVLAAGHGNSALAPSLGLSSPIRAERGQILVTERVAPLLRIPASGIRQTSEGTLLLGTSFEDVGFNDGTTVVEGARIANRVIRVLPQLARARLVRTWGGIRILTPDGAPVYAESSSCPGAFVAICHSGVTLASVHSTEFAKAVAAGQLSESLRDFNAERFAIPGSAIK